MTTHASCDEEWPEAIVAFDRLWRAETFEANTHFADLGPRDVVHEIFSSDDGWTIAAAEPGFFDVLYVLAHPEHGVGAMTLGTVEPGAGVGTEADWDTLSVKMRARNTMCAHLAQGPSALAILTHYKAYQSARGGGRMPSGVEHFVYRLLGSPAFMDAEATTMTDLGAFTDLATAAFASDRSAQEALVDAHRARSAGLVSTHAPTLAS